MSSFYLFRESHSPRWMRVVEYDECGFFVGQYMNLLNPDIFYTPAKDWSVVNSWQKVFNLCGTPVGAVIGYIFKYIPQEELVIQLMNSFKNINEDYPICDASSVTSF